MPIRLTQISALGYDPAHVRLPRTLRRVGTYDPAKSDEPVLTGYAGIKLVKEKEEYKKWNDLVQRYYYLGYKKNFGLKPYWR